MTIVKIDTSKNYISKAEELVVLRWLLSNSKDIQKRTDEYCDKKIKQIFAKLKEEFSEGYDYEVSTNALNGIKKVEEKLKEKDKNGS